MAPFKEVECHVGPGAPRKGTITIYPSAIEKGVSYWFWYMPIDWPSRSPKAFENTGLFVISRGGDGTVVWPPRLEGREAKTVIEEYVLEKHAEQHEQLSVDAGPATPTDPIAAVVARAERSGRRLVRTPAQDEKCKAYPNQPRFYSYAGSEQSDDEVVRFLLKTCAAPGPHTAMNIANWCCP